jgi:glycosyltransferase involved in cell wall biosynthesis
MTDAVPTLVSVVIPAWNEAADIAGCLEALAAQDHPADRMEVILVDGRSDDGTAEVATAAAAELGFARFVVLENPRRRTSISLNVAVPEVRGDVVVRIDARARVQTDYVRTCVEVLATRPEVGVVGGAQVPIARSERLVDLGISRSLNNRFATGLSRYRRLTASGPSDTVWMGVFRADELRTLGGWNDDVALNEDWELNSRYRAAGFDVWFVGDLQSRYLPRPSYRRLARQYFYFGRVKGMWWLRGMAPSPRQLGLLAIPPIAALVMLRTLRRVGWPALVALPLAFLAVDQAGAVAPARRPGERAASAAAIAVYTSAWWVGVVVGAVGELLGVEHQHRTVQT